MLGTLRRLLYTGAPSGRVLSRAVQLSSRTMSSPAAAGSTLDLTGIYPPIATPFDSKENVDYGKLQENLNKWNDIRFRGYVVQGSNGEYPFLSKEERVEMVQKTRNMVPPQKLIIAGSGCESTSHTIEMCKLMAAAGADAVLVVTPCYYKALMNNSTLENHYLKVADSSPVPVILYSVPGNTGIDMAADVIVKLAKHPNIIGVKDSGGDIAKIAGMVHKTAGEDFQVLGGSASFLYPALSLGAVGGVCALANMLGQACCDLQELSQTGQHQEAKQLQQRLVGPNAGVTKVFGVPGLKTAMEWFGYYGGPMRSPLLPLKSDDTATLRNIFVKSGFLDS